MMKTKKIVITGIAVILVMFFATCDLFFPKEAEEEEEYTDVVYTNGGSTVTIYLDGVGIPKRQARAMSTNLSKMAYDYLDVIFYSPAVTLPAAPEVVARSQWELGQSAGISGVPRGTATTGVDYSWKDDLDDTYALLAVGTKDGKTLLAIGQIGSVDGSVAKIGTWDGTILPTTAEGYSATIKPDTKYVTFYLESIKTGLIASDETTGDEPANAVGSQYNSFTPPPPNESTRVTLGDGEYPMYSLVNGTGTYKFEGAADTYVDALTLNGTIAVEKRVPRYLENGGYRIARGALNSRSLITAASTSTVNNVDLVFEAKGSGILSFYIDIPVIVGSKNPGTNGAALDYIPWHIRTGFGSELYSLDDGGASGGCVLMGIGATSLDWLEIYWEWIK